MTRVFNTKKELAERLMAGEKWRVVKTMGAGYCFYDEGYQNPWRSSYAEEAMQELWEYCDGYTTWEQVIDKPQTKTVWFWKVKIKHAKHNELQYTWCIYYNMCTEETIKKAYPDGTEYERLDILGSEEVEV